MRVALFGGSFNPPHVAHQLVGLYVLETRAVDELWLVPSFQHPFGKALTPFPHRLAMCERVAAALGPRARACDVEAQLGGSSRTLRTVTALQDRHPGHAFSLIIGADLIAELPSWYGSEELQRRVSFIVIGRTGFPGGSAIAMPAMSSTEVRARLAKGEPVDDYVPRAVRAYIDEHGLYRAVAPPETAR